MFLFYIPIFLYLLFLVGMSFVVLVKFSFILFGYSWWVVLKDISSMLASIATAFAFPWAIYLFFHQKEKDREERGKVELNRVRAEGGRLTEEVESDLSGDVVSKKQLIESTLYRVEVFIERNPVVYAKEFYFRINSIFNNFLQNVQFSTLSGVSMLKVDDVDYDGHGIVVGNSVGFTHVIFSMAYSYSKSGGYIILSASGVMSFQSRNSGLGVLTKRIFELAQPGVDYKSEEEWISKFINDDVWYRYVVCLSYIYLTTTQQGLNFLSNVDDGARTIDIVDFMRLSGSEKEDLYGKAR